MVYSFFTFNHKHAIMLKNLLSICLILLLTGITGEVFGQGVTTSAMSGRITDETGEALPGATIIAVHTPTGSQYGNVTDTEGFFRIPNMRVGGPYKVTISFVGYQTWENPSIYLTLGQTYGVNVQLAEEATELSEVLITADRNDVFDGNRTGQETVVDQNTIEALPTVSRSLGDYVRYNPLANIQEDTDGFAISIAGQNNRFNTIYIDGAVNNDVFGLAGSGTNGGQTGVQPVSIDAIEQFQVSVAPFDVRQSGFAGGAINAVTRSGTNEVEGSAYYFWRNENLAGKTPTDNEDIDREKLAEFTAKTYGFRLGGPIVKDKVFFFVNGEIQRDDRPQPFDFNNYRGSATRDDLNQLASFLRDNYNYDPGGFENNTAYLDSEKILGKIDWNISESHKLTLRHSYVRAENLEARSSSPTFLGFNNGSEFFISTTNSTALELSSTIGNNMFNKLTVGATIVRDDRDPLGDPFPTIRISQPGDDNIPDTNIEIGAERFSTANLLNQDIITVNNDFELFKGRHSLLFGANFEYYNVGNLFIRENYGSYRFFDGIDQFLNNQDGSGNPISSRIERSYSQVDNVAGDESEAIAAFEQILLGFYVQDQIQMSPNFKLTAGVRVDFPIFLDDVPVNQDFNNNTIPMIESFGYDMMGAETGSFIKTQLMIAPRVGFNWDVNGDQRTQLRGGVGLFTSRIPLVWQGGAFNNYGLNIGGGRNDDEPFNPDVNSQWPGEIDPGSVTPSGQVDLFAEDFKLPQTLKFNLAVDQKLPWGMVGTVEAIYSKNINYLRYQNLNLKPSTENLTGGEDNRPLFDQFDEIDSKYTGIYLASNTNEGYAYNFVASLNKPFDNGLSATLSYSYGDAYSLFDGTSSQNNSQWRGFFNENGRNNEGEAMRSNFSAGHRVMAQVAYAMEYAGFMSSEIGLIFNGQSGRPYTYVAGAFNDSFVNDGGFDFNELAYVPSDAADLNIVATSDYTVAEQVDALNAFINDRNGLEDYKGGYVERNTDRTPFEAIIDLRFLQNFFIDMGNGKRNTLQFSVDIFNFTNLLNKDWGRRYFMSFGTYSLYNVSLNGTTPEYTVPSDIMEGRDPWEGNVIDSGFRSSRWQMQLGLRYIFGNAR